MRPEDLIGPAAAKALAEHFELVPKAKPLAEVVTMEDVSALREAYRARWEAVNGTAPKAGRFDYSDAEVMRFAADALVLRWLRARLEALPELVAPFGDPNAQWIRRRADVAADTYKRLTGREWTP